MSSPSNGVLYMCEIKSPNIEQNKAKFIYISTDYSHFILHNYTRKGQYRAYS